MCDLHNVFRQSTILVPSGPAHDPDRLHLHIMLNDPVRVESPIIYSNVHNHADDFVQIVSISSCKDYVEIDHTCLLKQGDHDFITHPSFVSYAFTKIRSVAEISAGIEAEKYHVRGPMNQAVFDSIHAGVGISDDTPIKMVRFWNDYCC